MSHEKYKVQPSAAERIRRFVKKKENINLMPLLQGVYFLTTTLLDSFIENNGYLPSSKYYSSRCEIKDVSYASWIVLLKKANCIVSYTESPSNRKSDWIRFRVGPLLADLVNAHKIATEEIITVSNLNENLATKADRSDVEQLKREMKEVKSAIALLKAASAPPDTQAKKAARAKATATLFSVTALPSVDDELPN